MAASLPAPSEYAGQYEYCAPLVALAVPPAAYAPTGVNASPTRNAVGAPLVVYDTPGGYPSLQTAYPKQHANQPLQMSTALPALAALPTPNEYVAWDCAGLPTVPVFPVPGSAAGASSPPAPNRPRTSAVGAELGLSPHPKQKASVTTQAPAAEERGMAGSVESIVGSENVVRSVDEFGIVTEWRREELLQQMDAMSHLLQHHNKRDSSELRARYERVKRMLGQIDQQKRATTAEENLDAVDAGGSSSMKDTLVQYVVVRKDLGKPVPGGLGWGVGPIISQACHAVAAAIWLSRDTIGTKSYCASLDSMTKVVMEVKNQSQLAKLADNLSAAGIVFKLWIEEPEGIPTALATCPVPRLQTDGLFKKCQLYRG